MECDRKYTDDELHTLARLMASKLKTDKKLLRFNEIVAVARRYESEGAGVYAGLKEAIYCCVPGSCLYSAKNGPLTLLNQFELVQ